MPKNPEVEAWLRNYEGPQKATLIAARDVILGSFPEVTECIKWQSPTFVYLGNLASFSPRSKKHASLMFHYGAMIPGQHPALKGSGSSARFMDFADVADVAHKARALEEVCRAWIEMKSGKSPVSKRPTSRKPASTQPLPRHNGSR